MSDHPEAPACRYCGLPLAPAYIATSHDTAGSAGSAEDGAYCCFGCRFAAAIASEGGEEGQNRWTLARLGLAIFFTMNVMVFTMALWSRDVYADEASVHTSTAHAMYELLRYAGLFFSVPVLLLLGQPIVEQAWQGFLRRQITMDWLLLAGVVASYGYSALAMWLGDPHIYFEVGCVVLVAVTLGRWLEATGKLKTTQAIRSLQRLLPATARVLRETGEHSVPLDSVAIGESIRVVAGERIPLDGTIVRNRASVDQQLITGESQPVLRDVGDPVYAGSLNLDGDLTIQVQATASAGTLQRLVDLVTTALASKGAEQRLADRLTAWFVPVVSLLAVGTLVSQAWHNGWQAAIMDSLAVVLIACPCALGIATPMAVWAALGTAAQKQIVFRRGDTLSALAEIRAICFDKTGTITTGQAEVDHVWMAPNQDEQAFVRAVYGLASASDHILARAIRQHIAASFASSEAPGIPATGETAPNLWPLPTDVQTIAGRGVQGRLPELGLVYLGSEAYLRQAGFDIPIDETWRDQNVDQSTAWIGWQGQVRGRYTFREHLRPETRESLAQLKTMGLAVVLLTGDHRRRAEVLRDELQVDVEAELLPHDKLASVERLRTQFGRVAMVGDGVNDAPALAAADVGIALGCGADVSRDAADVCLLGNDLAQIPWAIDWARRTRRTIWQNLFWAFGYNAVGVTLAIFGWLNPIIAAIAMVGSSLFVISNSLRLAQRANANSADGISDATDDSLLAHPSTQPGQATRPLDGGDVHTRPSDHSTRDGHVNPSLREPASLESSTSLPAEPWSLSASGHVAAVTQVGK